MTKMHPAILVGFIFAALIFIAANLHAALPLRGPPALDVKRLIEAIKAVENWDFHTPGQHGEQGRMQFTQARWAEFTKVPLWWAASHTPHQIRETERVEVRYVTHLSEEAKRLGRPQTAFIIGLLHTAGYEAVRMKSYSMRKTEFAQRVQTIYDSTAE